MYEKDGKNYPFKIDEYYSVGLNSLKRVYTQHPKFNGNVRLIYELLLDYWNADYGYAFPDQWELARESGQSLSSIKRNINILKDLELIEVKKSPVGKKNNVYYIKKPVTTLEEFYRKFPDIEEESKKRIAMIDAEMEKSLEEWGKDAKKGEAYTRRKSYSTVIYPPKTNEEEVDQGDDLKSVKLWL